MITGTLSSTLTACNIQVLCQQQTRNKSELFESYHYFFINYIISNVMNPIIHPSKHNMLRQCRFNVGPASLATLAQHLV